MNNTSNWTKFSPFPSPLKHEYISAPFGAGVYELKNVQTNELVYVGEGSNVAYRMSSLLPEPYGKGTRNNKNLRKYIFENLEHIQYRTLSCIDKITAKRVQNDMIDNNNYLFN
jgi:excinuclease UvrABC nuclease subunit